MTLRIGSLCSGYEGISLAIQDVLGGEVAWVADTDPGACKILAHRFPLVPNLGDITAVDWTAIEPVDILVAGFPCQDISDAGQRAGIDGTRSGIWRNVADAIRVLRPGLVVIENVRSLLVRGMGRVLADLAGRGFDAEWRVLRASDAGAPHQRARVFIVAWPAADAATADEGRRSGGGGAAAGSAGRGESGNSSLGPAADTDRQDEGRRELPPRRHEPGRRPAGSGEIPADPECDGRQGGRAATRQDQGRQAASSVGRGPAERGIASQDTHGATGGERRLAAPGQAQSGRPRADAGGPGGAPAADTQGHRRDEGRPEPARIVGRPDAAERGHGLAADAAGCGRAQGHRVANGRPPALGSEAVGRPGNGGGPPADADSDGLPRGPERHGEPLSGQARDEQRRVDPLRCVLDWGAYEPAIRRWEAVLGRPAPRPTEPGRTGERLSPRFVEFLMGLPEGWVTDVPGLSRNAQLHALGNGVVPQQCALALRMLLGAVSEAAA